MYCRIRWWMHYQTWSKNPTQKLWNLYVPQHWHKIPSLKGLRQCPVEKQIVPIPNSIFSQVIVFKISLWNAILVYDHMSAAFLHGGTHKMPPIKCHGSWRFCDLRFLLRWHVYLTQFKLPIISRNAEIQPPNLNIKCPQVLTITPTKTIPTK